MIKIPVGHCIKKENMKNMSFRNTDLIIKHLMEFVPLTLTSYIELTDKLTFTASSFSMIKLSKKN